MSGTPAHHHGEECGELFGMWRRYHAVAADGSAAFSTDERLAAARERDMFGRQLRALGCSPEALLVLEAAAAVEDGTGGDA